MSHNYNELLKALYEIEGLLALQSQRGENAIPAVDGMIADKIAAFACEFAKDNTSSEAELCTDNVSAPDPESVVEIAVAEAETAEETTANTETETKEAEEESDAIAQSVAEEERGDADVTPAQEMTITLDEKLARERAQDIFKAFTLNDKFRFRRELFRDSQEEFDDALNIISQMSTIEEAEEYIYDDLCWDPENEDVKAFMDIVTKHF